MMALYQRLKELDSKSFERLCFQLLRERHPGANIRPVEGASGDQGADAFRGDLEDGSTIWQCKSFPNGIKKSQKDQIRDSLKQAVKNFGPHKWILCISVDMDIHAHKWFQLLTNSYAGRTGLGLMSAGDIVNELTHRKSIRDTFFPEAILDVSQLRSLVTKTIDLSVMEQAALAQENAEQLIERLKRRDARFNYEVSVSPDRPPQAGSRSGTTFSLSFGSTTIHAFPRDVEALRLDPPKMDFALNGSGVTKFLDFQRTGRSQTFEAGEVASVTTSLPLCDLFGFEKGGTLSIRRSDSLRTEVLPMRLVFGSDQERVVYEYMLFRLERVGTDEIEIVSQGEEPFTLTMVLLQKGGKFTFSEREFGFSVRSADKYIRAIAALALGGPIETYDLKTGKRLFSATPNEALPQSALGRYSQFFSDTTRLCEFFNVDLQLNRALTEDDKSGLNLLAGIMSGSTSCLQHITTTLDRTPQDEKLLLGAVEGEPANLVLEHPGMRIVVLDSAVMTGAFRVTAKALLQNADEARQRWNSAESNVPVQLIWEPIGAVAITRVQPI
jgi:hypothetical protein